MGPDDFEDAMQESQLFPWVDDCFDGDTQEIDFDVDERDEEDEEDGADVDGMDEGDDCGDEDSGEVERDF
jgi:hypothetical protein